MHTDTGARVSLRALVTADHSRGLNIALKFAKFYINIVVRVSEIGIG